MKQRPSPARGMSPPPGRAAALEALGAVFSGADVQAALDASLKRAVLSPADSALATQLVYGTLRRHLRHAWLLEHVAGREAGLKLPQTARNILLLAVEELCSLSRVPAYATVNWAVEALKQSYGRGLSGLGNALLRRVAALGTDTQNRDWYAARLQGAELDSIYYSVPQWLPRLWAAEYGDAFCNAMLEALLAPPVPAVRVNAARQNWEQIRTGLIEEQLETGARPVGHNGIAFAGRLPDSARELARQGALSAQGAGSQDILHRLAPESWPGPIWDACAGRGGKTLALLERGLDVTLASDPSAARLRGLEADAARLGLPVPRLIRAGAADAANSEESFGAILVDAPCSGLGTLVRRPDILLRRTPEDINKLASTQAAILDACVSRLRPGGVLAYCTCTLTRAENEEQVHALLKRQPMRIEHMHTTPPDAGLGEWFFCARLRRE